jgi:tetratricopeptide (TPR) repeat protein
VTALIAAAAVWASAARAADVWPDVLDAYARAEFTDVDHALAGVDATPETLEAFRKSAGSWVNDAAPAGRARRSTVAAALALEVLQASLEAEPRSWVDNLLKQPSANLHRIDARLQFVVWAESQASAGTAAADASFTRAWYLASIAAMERIGGIPEDLSWGILLGVAKWSPGMSSARDSVIQNLGDGGYLARAERRLPGESRVRLAKAEGHEYLDTYCAMCFAEATPDVLDQLRHDAGMTVPTVITNLRDGELVQVKQQATRNLAGFDRLPAMAFEYAALAQVPAVQADADLHIGYLAIRATRYEAALGPLDTVRHVAREPQIEFLAEYLTGRALGRLGRHDEAVAALRRALVLVPHAASAAVMLSSELLRRGGAADRAEAYAVLDAALGASPAPPDPWATYWEGDGWRLPAYVRQVREALR